MENTIAVLRGVISLDEQTYRDFLTSKDVMKRGFLILLACFLIAGLPVFGQRFISAYRGFEPEVVQGVQEQMTTLFSFMQMPEGFDEEFMRQFQQNFQIGMDIGQQLDELPTPLPRVISAFLQALGAWISATISPIGPWLGYGILVLLLAKMAGGRGILNHFFGLTALYAMPNLLGVFDFIPFVGPALSLLGLIWGIVVYVRAVQVSQEFTAGKAMLITFLPVLIVMLLGACIGTMGFFSLASLIGAGQ